MGSQTRARFEMNEKCFQGLLFGVLSTTYIFIYTKPVIAAQVPKLENFGFSQHKSLPKRPNFSDLNLICKQRYNRHIVNGLGCLFRKGYKYCCYRSTGQKASRRQCRRAQELIDSL